jgi:hypothetical protein
MTKLIAYSIIFLLLSLPVMADPNKGFFSQENMRAIKDNPSTLFSAVNTCRLKTVFDKKDFTLFSDAMSQMTVVDDEPGFVSVAGNAKGLFTIYEGFVRMTTAGKVWIAYLYDGKVNYFTNDAATVSEPPKVMRDWASRFKEATWVNHLLIAKPVICSKTEGEVAKPTTKTKIQD